MTMPTQVKTTYNDIHRWDNLLLAYRNNNNPDNRNDNNGFRVVAHGLLANKFLFAASILHRLRLV